MSNTNAYCLSSDNVVDLLRNRITHVSTILYINVHCLEIKKQTLLIFLFFTEFDLKANKKIPLIYIYMGGLGIYKFTSTTL